MTAPQCDQCRGKLWPVDLLTGHTTCVECVRRNLDHAIRLKHRGQSISSAAHPDDRARVDAAIKQLAATGKPFSANDARQIHGVRGGVVGAAFGAMKNAGVIKPAGNLVRSTSAETHGHHVFQWIGAAA